MLICVTEVVIEKGNAKSSSITESSAPLATLPSLIHSFYFYNKKIIKCDIYYLTNQIKGLIVLINFAEYLIDNVLEVSLPLFKPRRADDIPCWLVSFDSFDSRPYFFFLLFISFKQKGKFL